MKALFSTAFLAPISYFSILQMADEVFLEKFETYSKQSYRNRAVIYSANGSLDITIPVEKIHGNHTLSSEMIVCNKTDWNKKCWRAIESAYRSTPFFIYYSDEYQAIFDNPPKTLWELNQKLLKLNLKHLQLKKTVSETDSFEKKTLELLDFRNSIHPKAKPDFGMVFPEYFQVFSPRLGFKPNMSILDLIFHLGPDANGYLQEVVLPIEKNTIQKA